jgi:TPR repeat protein
MWKWLAFVAVLAGAWIGALHWPVTSDFIRGRADNNLGVLYSRGLFVRKDPVEAVRWWRLAADHGSAAGQINLGFALQSGSGVAPDETAAAEWYEKAARQGVVEAANNLGTLYANPMTRKPDLVQARVWLKRALRIGDRDLSATIADNLATLERDMSGAEIVRSNEVLATPYP